MKYLNDKVCGYRLGTLSEAPIPEVAALSRVAAGEGIVLLKNEANILPLKAGERISVFGRMQKQYCKSGTGSGGLVNVTYVTNIIDSLREHKELIINESLAKIYEEWVEEHPFDRGKGWAQEPWCQEEMPLTREITDVAASVSDKAIVIICRTAGEDKDNSATPGSWFLTAEEENILACVTASFKNVCVVLNVGNIIDMNWVEKYKVGSVVYGWQGGMEGGRATADVLCGDVTPSGKLTDTIAHSIEDYPAFKNFGNDVANIYQEDIYVGYRYFETFAPEKVLYPFGFGLSYTHFEIATKSITLRNGIPARVTVKVQVKNVGECAGKEVVQVYLGAPQGKLGKAEKVLVAFDKTPLLAPGKSCNMKITFSLDDFASYDDSGVTGHKSAYVLEAGQYLIYVGTDCHSCEAQAAYGIEERVVEQCREALSPVTSFERLRPDANGKMTYEPVPTRTYDLASRIKENRPVDISYTGDRGIKLVDVRNGKATMEEFIAQLPDSALLEITRGEGMSSPKVTPGTGGCLGGVTQQLADFGIPIACVTDGPSGLRMDSGLQATSMPNGTMLACTWNLDLVYALFLIEGVEMTAYKIDALLGPGINIHRHPLNGRNFEYFSEDPYLTGVVAAQMCKALEESDVCCTIKHFMANNQEWKRSEADSVLSERAAREIYLFPFEIAVKDGGAQAIMTSYNLVNGIHAASNYDLNTSILRDEWGYDGFVMTDWWAKMNEEGEKGNPRALSLMIRAQNDVFMIDSDSATRADDGAEALKNGNITRGEVQRCAANLCHYLMYTHAMERMLAGDSFFNQPVVSADISTMECVVTVPGKPRGSKYDITVPADGDYVMTLSYHADGQALAQIPVSVLANSHRIAFLMLKATEGTSELVQTTIKLTAGETTFALPTNSDALHIDEVKLYR